MVTGKTRQGGNVSGSRNTCTLASKHGGSGPVAKVSQFRRIFVEWFLSSRGGSGPRILPIYD